MGREAAEPPVEVADFVGREAALGRVEQALAAGRVAVLYGLPGIGKTELAYRALRSVRAKAGWGQASPIIVKLTRARRGAAAVDALRRELNPRARAAGAASPGKNESPRHVVLLDDVDALGVVEAAALLDELARQSPQSRVIATSRIALPARPGGVCLSAILVEPLAEAEARELVLSTARSLGLDGVDVEDVVRAALGSPHEIHRLLGARATPARRLPDLLAEQVHALPKGPRALLLRLSLLGVPVSVEACIDRVGAPCSLDNLQTLQDRFLASGGDVVSVPPLVRDVTKRAASRSELRIAMKAIASQFELDRLRTRSALDVIAVVEALTLGGASAKALELVEQRYTEISAAGLDHRLLPVLDALKPELDGAARVDLLRARALLRLGRIREADEVASRLLQQLPRNSRVAMVAAAIALRAGRADEALRAYRALEPRCHGDVCETTLRVHIAFALATSGKTAEAERELARADEVCTRERDRRKIALVRAIALVLGHRPDEAVRQLHVVRVGARERMDDLDVLAGLVRVLVSIARDDMAAATEHLDALSRAVEGTGFPRAWLGAASGAVSAVAGDVRAATAKLGLALRELTARGDEIMHSLWRFYLAQAQLASGRADVALDLLAEEIAAPSDARRSLTHALLARACISRGALDQADEILASVGRGESPSSARALASLHCAEAYASAIRGDLAGARTALDAARTAVDGDLAGEMQIALDQAEIELMGGDLSVALSAARVSREYYETAGRSYFEARATTAEAFARLALSRPQDAEPLVEALSHARSLCSRFGYEHLQARIGALDLAVAQRDGREAPSSAGARERGFESDLLRHLRAPAMFPNVALGVRRFADALRTPSDERLQLTDSRGTRQVASAELPELVKQYDLVIDLSGPVLRSRHLAEPLALTDFIAALLVRLALTEVPVTPKALFEDVWNGPEYHPLRHRNAVYVAVARARRMLAAAVGVGNPLPSRAGGWLLAPKLTCAVLRSSDGPPSRPSRT